MKIMIADDMEGISGVVDWTHVENDHSDYQRFRRVMTAEVNAAIRGAFEGGADEVVLTDGHDYARNVMIEDLDPRARLNSGSPSPYSMMTGIDDKVDALIFVGYHSRAGTRNGILAHTWTTRVFNLWLNDLLLGEIGLNASLAGHFGVPLIMVSSDQAGTEEAAALVPGVETVAVKRGSGMFAAECLKPEVSQPLIQQAAERAVKRFKGGQGPAPIKTSYPVRVKVELATPNLADAASVLPFVTRLDGRTLITEAPDMPTAHRMFRSITGLAK
jgi:D-amino peptidase